MKRFNFKVPAAWQDENIRISREGDECVFAVDPSRGLPHAPGSDVDDEEVAKPTTIDPFKFK